MSKTLPEQIEELTSKVTALATEKADAVSQLEAANKKHAEALAASEARIKTLETENASLKATADASAKSISDLNAKLQASEAKAKTVEEKAAEILAGVGQSKAAGLDEETAKGEAKTLTERCQEAKAAKK